MSNPSINFSYFIVILLIYLDIELFYILSSESQHLSSYNIKMSKSIL
jgi:hypothetical protein